MSQAAHFSTPEPEITFWTAAPAITGLLDEAKSALPVRRFPHVMKLNPASTAVEASYRLAYGTDFLYVLIQIEKTPIVCRDRGYQHGDGMLLALGAVQPEGKITPEYYLLGFWPDPEIPGGVGKMLWGYNGTWPLRGMDESTRFVVKEVDGRIHFELLLPWKEVPPYHPWLSEKPGLSLVFSEATAEDSVNYHGLIAPEEDAQSPDTVGIVQMTFESPALAQGMQTYITGSRHGTPADNLPLHVVTLAAQADTEEVSLYAMAGEGNSVAYASIQYPCEPGLTRREESMPTDDLIPGGYQLRWVSQKDSSKGMFGFSLLPPFDPQAEEMRLNQLEHTVPAGTANTLRFKMQDLQQELSRLKAYEICPRQRIGIEKYHRLVEKIESGEDSIANGRGIMRRAFRSKLDNTLQPYSISVPAEYDPRHSYPLMVFLHGSDRDDTELPLYTFLCELKNWIVLMPFGRGMLNYYTRDNAQEDIQEAIEDVCLNYSIDEDHMVVGGFSMGGYGAYRTYYETPNRYQGAAVFSGLPRPEEGTFPNLDQYPNFLNDAYLQPFDHARVFIFHGTGDHNAPFRLTEQVAQKLRSVGADVTFKAQSGTGHDIPNEENTLAFSNWLDAILAK